MHGQCELRVLFTVELETQGKQSVGLAARQQSQSLKQRVDWVVLGLRETPGGASQCYQASADSELLPALSLWGPTIKITARPVSDSVGPSDPSNPLKRHCNSGWHQWPTTKSLPLNVWAMCGPCELRAAVCI